MWRVDDAEPPPLPPTPPLQTGSTADDALLANLCADARLSDDSTALIVTTAPAEERGTSRLLELWAEVLDDDRPAFMRLLQRIGLASLRERQALANALSRALRQSRIPRPPRAASPPPLEEIEREAATRLRASTQLLLDAFGSDGAVEQAVALTDGALLAALPEAKWRGLLEAAGVRPRLVRAVHGAAAAWLPPIAPVATEHDRTPRFAGARAARRGWTAPRASGERCRHRVGCDARTTNRLLFQPALRAWHRDGAVCPSDGPLGRLPATTAEFTPCRSCACAGTTTPTTRRLCSAVWHTSSTTRAPLRTSPPRWPSCAQARPHRPHGVAA